MKGIFDRLDSGVFRDERMLLPEHQPSELLFREAEIRAVARAFSGVATGQRPENVFVFGPTGTGKTSVARFVLDELKEYTEKASAAYVNCWEHDSRQAVLSLIADSLGEALPRRGIGSDEIFSRVVQSMRYQQKACIVVLDEADRIAESGNESLFYDLSRAKENHGASFGLVLVSNSQGLLSGLDDRIRSSLRLSPVEFRKYSPSQLKDILSARAKNAFNPGACDDEIIGLCAAFGAKAGGDARVALETLWQAGRNAEKLGAEKIGEKDVRDAYASAGGWKAKQRATGVLEGEQLVLDLLSKIGEITSGELYEKYKAVHGESDRQVRNYVDALERRKLVVTRDVQSPKGKGKTRMIRQA